jgi:sulfate transport system substrate-binding protein
MDALLAVNPRDRKVALHAVAIAVSCAALAGCGEGGASASAASTNPGTQAANSLTLGAYTTPREAYGKAIVPAFKARWRKQAGAELDFKDSYLASGAQARAILGGFEADVAALSLEPDIEKLREAGLITHDWKAGEHGGMVSRSLVVIGVRKGNPKGIRDFTDLAREGVEVLTPDVRTSGGAMWNVAAIYGAAVRASSGTGTGSGTSEAAKAAATKLLAGVLANVKILDKGARESLLNFERGVGDAIVTYENEILVGRMKGQDYEYVIPRSTVLIENPIALVDANADKHGSRKLAEAFLAFLRTPEAQRAFAEYGLRPVSPALASELGARFPAVSDLFTIADLGGWTKLQAELFARGAVYDQALQAARGSTK